MERTERLLDLVALFLDEKRPVSWQRLRTLFVQHASGEIEQTSAHHGVALGAGALVIESDLEGVHW